MAYWWVNHNKMHRAELDGGYIWCPQNSEKVERVGYANLTLVEEGDVIFSYAKQQVGHVGVAKGPYENAPRPSHKGYSDKHRDWKEDGWRVLVDWEAANRPVHPKEYLADLAPYPGQKHGALRVTGEGKEAMYLSEVPEEVGDRLLGLLDSRALKPKRKASANADEIERKIRSSGLPETTKKALIDARVGQGLFRSALLKLYRSCPITGVSNPALLVASHIKAWKNGTNEERLDPYNGLLLAPHIDKLFDRGFISFSDSGEMLISNPGTKEVLKNWHVPSVSRIPTLGKNQRIYMAYHRKQHNFE
ncbi:MAG: HNH endonuclease signature motif containing protein [Acidovorax sp.]|uniref:HNH endonuclease n=1 Tax=Acidovorax sp. TaxID=1872122 RepID=UPI002628041B|nr:HNH endonuclease signature motif containing protein [Acidovorax sp.]MDH4417711.1 HNH endonuclease signature motif containing protein [Acidovorax sp.]